MGTIVCTVGGLPSRRALARVSLHFGGDAYGKNRKEGDAILLDVIDAIASVICAVGTLIQITMDIFRFKKEKSNRPPKV